jgi:hypothetical protein
MIAVVTRRLGLLRIIRSRLLYRLSAFRAPKQSQAMPIPQEISNRSNDKHRDGDPEKKIGLFPPEEKKNADNQERRGNDKILKQHAMVDTVVLHLLHLSSLPAGDAFKRFLIRPNARLLVEKTGRR